MGGFHPNKHGGLPASKRSKSFVFPTLDGCELTTEEYTDISLPFHINTSCSRPDDFDIIVAKKDSVYQNRSILRDICNIRIKRGKCHVNHLDTACSCASSDGMFGFKRNVTRLDSGNWTWRSYPEIADQRELIFNITCPPDFGNQTGMKNVNSTPDIIVREKFSVRTHTQDVDKCQLINLTVFAASENRIQQNTQVLISRLSAGAAAFAVIASVSVSIFVVCRFCGRRNGRPVVRRYGEVPQLGVYGEGQAEVAVMVANNRGDGAVMAQNIVLREAVPNGNAYEEIPEVCGPRAEAAHQQGAAAPGQAAQEPSAEDDIYVPIDDILARERQAQ
ncbi:hypothetical protein BaRGS_00013401 [Batillaria attramentaria]|uniref:Uncharacterized protein n=1 Tax=Batillaria attramentaria TaxID=370345 RepID=A0ABD0L8G0_9CAEN